MKPNWLNKIIFWPGDIVVKTFLVFLLYFHKLLPWVNVYYSYENKIIIYTCKTKILGFILDFGGLLKTVCKYYIYVICN